MGNPGLKLTLGCTNLLSYAASVESCELASPTHCRSVRSREQGRIDRLGVVERIPMSGAAATRVCTTFCGGSIDE